MSEDNSIRSDEEKKYGSTTDRMFANAARMFTQPDLGLDQTVNESQAESEPANEPQTEREPVNEPQVERESEKSIRQQSVSEILEDYDWEDYEDVDLDEDYHHHVRREHKAREHRLWVRLTRKIAIAIGVVAVLVGVFLYGFRMKNIVVTGNHIYSDEEILSLVGYYKSPKNTLYFTWKNREDLTDGVQFIDRITVTMGGPTTVYVTVKEKMIIGCIDDNGLYMFFDNTGEVVESSTSRPTDVPLIQGLDVSGIELGDILDLENKSVFNNLYELTVLLKNYEVSVEEICYNEDQSMVMYDGDIKILLGMGNNLEDKINAYKDLESSLEGMSGTLHLEDYNSSKESIFFSNNDK